jgi:hypothetical protein
MTPTALYCMCCFQMSASPGLAAHDCRAEAMPFWLFTVESTMNFNQHIASAPRTHMQTFQKWLKNW